MRKTLLTMAICIFAALTTFAQQKESSDGVKFVTGTFNELLEKAKEAKKPIFLDVYATWCGPCKFMSSNVFPQKAAGDYFNPKFVNSKIDGETEEGKAIMKKFGVRAYPTFLILNDKGEEIARVVGGDRTAEDFTKRVEEALKEAGK